MDEAFDTRWTTPLAVCIVQPRISIGDVDHNLDRAIGWIRKAADDGPLDVVVLPEVFTTGFPYDRLPELSGSSKRVMADIGRLAAELSTHIMFTLVIEDQGRYFNRFMSIGPDGRVETTYDKTHLFSRAGEDRFFTRGEKLVQFEIGGAIIAPLICYELRYPELSRKQVLEGADILVYPAQWPAYRVFQWETLLRARAIENQCYVIGVGGSGSHGTTEMGGHSMVVAPFGDILCSIDQEEGFARTVIGPERLRNIRKRIPALADRRPDLY
ncbi:MAG: carbon-nitrogen family hydrolase [Candidatus Thermoplasmatota archaeon]|nr:carbon-nitrogen family hydrolase [Candidatus Thermoplasmatota archaeon]